MKLFYYQRPDGQSNFGDQLNSWLWNKLLPGIFDGDETTTFVGIGTLLNSKLPKRIAPAEKAIIFSSGVGYEKNLAVIPQCWHIYCVRGFLSARKLGIDEKLVITDGAILIRRLFHSQERKAYRYSFMPHIHHAKFAGKVWEKICAEMDWQYIDPRWSVEEVLFAISRTEILIAEAMHGAIVADALQVPWIPVTTSPRILTFKWQDWCSSLGVTYQPNYLIPLADYPAYGRGVRSSIRAMQYWSICWWQAQLGDLLQMSSKQREVTKHQLELISKNTQPCLSNEEQSERLTVRLESKLEKLKQDLEMGKFQ